MKRLVVKIGGHALDALDASSVVLRELAHDVGAIAPHTSTVIVHGGGPQIAALLDEVGLTSKVVDGLRVTDERTMPYVAMALAWVNVQITASLQHAGLASIGLSGADGNLVRGTALGPPWGQVATSLSVRGEVITSLQAMGWTPVVSSIGVDQGGRLVNCNADTVAGSIAESIDADALVLLSDVDQLRSDPEDPNTAQAVVTTEEVRELIALGAIRDGMLPKVTAALGALGAGARRVILANGTRPHALASVLTGGATSTEVRL